MPVRFFLDGPISLDKTFADWHSLDLSRDDQWHRSSLAGHLNHVADQLAAEVGGDDRADRWQRARDLRVIANAVQNNSALGGSCGGLRWRLELDPFVRLEDGEAA
jgi:hypothetical protein